MSISALADRLAFARRAAARIQREVDQELQAIDSLMEDPSLWSEEDPARRDQLEAKLQANQERLELLAQVVANRDAMQAEYTKLAAPRSVTLAEFKQDFRNQRLR